MNNLKIQRLIFANIFPLKYFYVLFFFWFLSFISPLLLLASSTALEIFFSHPFLVVSLGIFFLFFSCITIFLFTQLKNPFMQEWKEKLGYEEIHY